MASSVARAGTYLGFDFGRKRVGVAVAALPPAVAVPYTTLTAAPEERLNAELDRLIEQWRPTALVVGIPISPVPSPGSTLAPLIQRFAHHLVRRYCCPVYLIDETLTSVDADALLTAAGLRRWRQRKKHRDALAAQLILQSFCDGAVPFIALEPDNVSRLPPLADPSC
ncbi:MAG: Holliday junction resolvase RuvX [Hydrogenophilus sp.]|nr:Holliday junction resolvase RuvX [Hydrogenophilus sp.]